MSAHVAALAQESWREADLALARAYAEAERARRALAGLARKQPHAKPVLGAQEALILTLEELAHGLRLRGLVPFGKIGSVAAFDPLRHGLETGAAESGAMVRFQAPGVAGPQRGIVLKAMVRRVRSRKSQGET